MTAHSGSRIITPDVLSIDFANRLSYNGGVTINDLTGLGGVGELFNSPAHLNGYLSFNNTGYVRFTRDDINGGSFQYGEATIEFWYRPLAGDTGSTNTNVLTIEKTFEISVADTGNGVDASIKYASNPWAWYGPNTGAFVGKWNLISYVHTLSDRKVYVNGDLIFTSSHTGSLSSGTAEYPYLTLGGRYSGTGSQCNGDIGVVRIYSRPLSQEEIRTNYHAQATRFNSMA